MERRLCYNLFTPLGQESVYSFGAGTSEELTMVKSILAITILALSTSVALAAQRTHHRQAMNANAAVPASPSPVGWWGGASGGDQSLYMRNLRDSGYNTKNNFNASGNLATQ
jgi:hypothetical protein